MIVTKFGLLMAAASTISATQVGVQELRSEPWTRELNQRAPAVIDFKTMPTCAAYYCEKTDFTGLCEPVACPSAGPEADSKDCIEKDCFCKLKFPMNCGWTACSWGDWFSFEDWFSATCPDAFKVDYTGLPKCAQSCLPDQYMIYGCITQSRSCLCQGQKTFGCASKCDEASNKTINGWFTDMCGTPIDVTTVASEEDEDGDDDAPPSQPSGKHAVQRIRPKADIHWYEYLAIVIGSLTILALLVWCILSIQLSRKTGQKSKSI
ncbi:hypothetical protein VTL71DRAFT_11536 [Oculimacula yallundae]|uniref:Uncharacterized protein n=1 Tax=Oculimacula yallundae TaxID=86028 RepID=A0ABR4CR18_9HELO